MLRTPVEKSQLGSSRPGQGADAILRAAERGINGGGVRLPHLDAIQHSFGHHDYVLSSTAHNTQNADHYYTREIVALEEGTATDKDLTPT